MDKRTLRWPAILVKLMALLAYIYVVPHGLSSNPDGHIAMARAIVDDHTLYIDRYATGLVDRAQYRGHYYTDKAPGISFLAVPTYAALRLILPAALSRPDHSDLVRYLLTALVLGLPAALFIGLFWRFLLPTLGRHRAALLTLGYALGTIAWPLSSQLFSHIIAAMSLFGAFMLLYPVSIGRCSATSWRWTASGVLCGLAVLCEYPAAIVGGLVALLAAHTAWREDRSRAVPRLALFTAAGLAALAPLAIYDRVVYGNPFSLGYEHEAGDPKFAVGMSHNLEGVGLPHLDALWGITFSPYRGLFVLSPFLLLAIPGLAAMCRRKRQRPAAALCATAVVAMLLFNAGYYMWDGGATVGPRHLGPALPFLTFPVAFALRQHHWYRIAPWLIGLSIAVMTLCCTTVLAFDPIVRNPLIQSALPRLLSGPEPNRWGFVPDSWGTLLGLPGMTSAAPFVIGEALLGLALWRSLRAQRRSPRSGMCA